MENLVGILLPPIVEYCNKDVQSDEERFIVAVIVCLITACLLRYQAILNGNLSDLFQTFLLVTVEAIGTFNLYWRNSFPRDWMQTKLGTTNNNALRG